MAPGSILATSEAPPRDDVSVNTVCALTQGATNAVRRALSSDDAAQPVTPSLSRT